MNKKMIIPKKVGAALAAMAMLCGTIMSSVWLPTSLVADQAEDVKYFSADFAQAEALVPDSSFSNAVYTPAQTDTQLNEWLETKFAFYGKQESHKRAELAYPGQNSAAWDSDASEAQSAQWQIRQNGGLYMQLNGWHGEMLRKHQSLTLKTDDGELAVLKNFEAQIVFNKAGANALGAVYLSFRETEPGNLAFNSSGTLAAGTDAVIVGNGKSTNRGNGSADGITPGNVGTFGNNQNMSRYFPTTLDNSANYVLLVRVVGTALTWRVVRVSDESTVDMGQATIANADAGYLSVGARNRELLSIVVTELDADGDPVDFGTSTPKNVETFKADFSQLALGAVSTDKDNAVTKYLNSKFHFYYEQEGVLFRRPNVNEYYVDKNGNPITGKLDSNITVYAPGTGVDMGSSQWKDGIGTSAYVNGIATWTVSQGGFLSCDATYTSGEYFRRYNQMTVLDANGEAAKLQNFEMTMTFKLRNVYRDHLTIAFRAATEAAAVTKNGSDEDRALLSLNTSGYFLGGPTDDYTSNPYENHFCQDQWADVTYSALGTTETYTLKLRVVGKNLTATIYKADGSVLTTYTKETKWTDEGYIVIGGSNAGGYYGTMEITRLDTAGNPVNFTQTETFVADFANAAALVTTFENGTYIPGEADTELNTWLTERFGFFGKQESHKYAELAYPGQSSAEWDNDATATSAAQWQVKQGGSFYMQLNGWHGEMLRKHQSLTVKMKNGQYAVLKNFSAEIVFSKGGDNALGAMYLSFHEEKPGNLAFNASGTVAAGTDAVIVGNGKSTNRGNGSADGITPGNIKTFANNQNLSRYFDTALDNTAKYILSVTVVGDTLEWQLQKDGERTVLYAGKSTIEEGEGYLSVGARNRNIHMIKVTRLDEFGNALPFTQKTEEVPEETVKTFFADFAALSASVDETAFVNGVYVPDDRDVQAEAFITSRFGAYGVQESHVYTELRYPFQSSEEWDGDHSVEQASRWELRKNGGLYMRVSGWHGEMLRKHQALTVKTTGGALAKLKNFEAEIVFNKGGANLMGAVYVSFRETTPGRLAMYSDGRVAQGTDAVIVGNGKSTNRGAGSEDGITAGNIKQFNDNQNMSQYFAQKLDDTANYTLYVKVVGTTLSWSITKEDDEEAVYQGTSVINDDTAGYLSIGARNRELRSVKITELNAVGEPIDFNGMEQGVDCPWETKADTFTQDMNVSENDLDAVYDFYYTDANGTVKETLATHWEQQTNGTLVRKNDLDGNATEKLAMLHFHGEDNKKFANVDAVLRLTITEEHQGTFWVTARQGDAANIGKLVATPGENDFLTEQVAVGFTVGGDILIADGKHDAFTISGPNSGTPSGTYVLRVRLYNEKLEVYVNGVLRCSRTLKGVNTEEGYFSFGCSSAAFGIGQADITRLDANGVAVDMESEYVAVDNPSTILLSVGADYETDLLPQLPQTVTVTKKDNTTEEVAVYWEPSGVNLSVEGDYHLIGYLQNINGIRASVVVLVGMYDRDTTKIYTFDDASQLEDFESWYLPATNVMNQPAIHTEGTSDDNWFINNGKLTYRQNSMYLSGDALKEGQVINGVFYKDDVSWNAYTGNFGIAVLKVPYENFILEVDYQSNYFWNIIGFGAADYTNSRSVFSSQKNGGYSFRVENGSGVGTAKLSGYIPEKRKCDVIEEMKMPYVWNASDSHHYMIIVSDGIARLYLDDVSTPLEVELPATYVGGYIYLAHNNGGGFDNLRITDLDSKDIYITEVLDTGTTVDIDRANGDTLNCNGLVRVADKNGYIYSLPYTLESDTYRSYIPGEHTFTANIQTLTNVHLPSNLRYTVTVNNRINDDFDATASRKYYFDHPNDLLDFYSQASLENYNDVEGYYSGYDGELITVDFADRWDIVNGRVTTNYTAEAVGWSDTGRLVGTSSLVLKDVNLMNFRVEMDYTQGNTFWYSYLLLGVQNPNKYIGNIWWGQGGTFEEPGLYGKQLEYYPEWGGGVWAFLEREGRFNVYGALEGVNNFHMANDLTTDFIKTYDASKQHHMVIEVKNGQMYMQVDDSDVYEFALDYEAWGGLVGFAAHGNGSTFDNFQITALDADGNVVPLANAEYGTSAWQAPSYSGWIVPRSEWFFEWGKEYELK